MEDEMKFRVNVVSSLREGGDEVVYFQVMTPGGVVLYDHLGSLDGAQRFCDHLNLGLREVRERYEPVVAGVERLRDAWNDFGGDPRVVVVAMRALFGLLEEPPSNPPDTGGGDVCAG